MIKVKWLALAAAVALSPLLVSGAAPAVAGPPVSGAMQNFTVHAEPKPAPEVSFEDGNGDSVTLADFAGQVVLVNLWATWCAPCRVEMPDLDWLQGELGGERFQVVAVSGDRAGQKAVREFYQDVGVVRLAPYVDKSMATHRAFGARGLPTTVLLDHQGREVGRMVGAAEWASPAARALIGYYIARTGRPADDTKETRRRE